MPLTGFPHGRPCQSSAITFVLVPSPGTKRPSVSPASEWAVCAISGGSRVWMGTLAVPTRADFVAVAMAAA